MTIKSALIVFAREPKDGKVKTRLAGDLPARAVTLLYKALVKDVLEIAIKVRCDERYIFYAHSSSCIPFLRKAARGFCLRRQSGGDLGERMSNAFEYCQRRGFNRVVIIGSDCLTVTGRDIESAFRKLGSCDCVLGPAKDGGYYLIATRELYKELFQGIDWGTSAVFQQTLLKLKKIKKSVFLLPRREDIDRFSQIKNVFQNIRNVNAAPHTRKALKAINIP